MKLVDDNSGRRQSVADWTAFCAWAHTPLGRGFLEAEQRALDEVLSSLFGYHLIQIGNPGPLDLSRSGRTLRRYLMDAAQDLKNGHSCVVEPEQLPVRSDCIDVVVMPHTLEFCADPHQALREADRVLIPEGHLVLCVFNPLSLWGLRRMLERRQRAPWNGRSLAVGRLKDWLGLLGFETRSVDHFYRAPPVIHGTLSQGMRRLSRGLPGRLPGLAGGCLLLARKKVSTLTPIRPRWAPGRPLVAARLMEPSSRSSCARRTG
jgi:SAM-dependent methyltransferase